MKRLVDLGGSLAGWIGVLTCLVAGVLRVTGVYHFSGYETMTLFNGGVGLIVAGAFAKIEVLGMR
jgi:hypothetical protein